MRYRLGPAVKILFRSQGLRRRCECRREAVAAWGESAAALVGRRLDDLRATAHLHEFLELPHIQHTSTGHAIRVQLDIRSALILEAPTRGPSERTGKATPTTVTILEIEGNHAPRKK
jgi:hypothetical protein